MFKSHSEAAFYCSAREGPVSVIFTFQASDWLLAFRPAFSLDEAESLLTLQVTEGRSAPVLFRLMLTHGSQVLCNLCALELNFQLHSSLQIK